MVIKEKEYKGFIHQLEKCLVGIWWLRKPSKGDLLKAGKEMRKKWGLKGQSPLGLAKFGEDKILLEFDKREVAWVLQKGEGVFLRSS